MAGPQRTQHFGIVPGEAMACPCLRVTLGSTESVVSDLNPADEIRGWLKTPDPQTRFWRLLLRIRAYNPDLGLRYDLLAEKNE